MILKKLSEKSPNNRLMQLCKIGKYNHVAKELGLTLIQIVERDNQITHLTSNENTFYNTWSVIGLLDETTLRAEVSWGTHEKKIPNDADVSNLDDSCQIRLPLLGNQLRTLSFEPEGGKLTGYCIPHAECYSLANYLQVKDGSKNISVYRPSVYYSYLIPDTAKLISHYLEYCLDDNGLPKEEHVLRSDEIHSGFDSVGCLAFFNNGKRYWMNRYGYRKHGGQDCGLGEVLLVSLRAGHQRGRAPLAHHRARPAV
jgi:homospermidine synthase